MRSATFRTDKIAGFHSSVQRIIFPYLIKHRLHQVGRELQVPLGGLDVTVTQNHLHQPCACAILEHIDSEAVPEGVRAFEVDTCLGCSSFEQPLDSLDGDRATDAAAGIAAEEGSVMFGDGTVNGEPLP